MARTMSEARRWARDGREHGAGVVLGITSPQFPREYENADLLKKGVFANAALEAMDKEEGV